MTENKNTPQRSDMRKKKRMNFILNGSIGVVALLIVFIVATIFFGGNSDEAVVSNESIEETNQSDINIPAEDGNEDENDSNNLANDGNVAVNNDSVNDSNSNSENDSNSKSENEANESNNEKESNDNSNDLDGINVDSNNNSEEDDEEWSPIGTEQDELSLVFDSGHVNREEMDKALQYATGLKDNNMEVWRIENGGDSKTAVGFVSTYDGRHTPYKVTLSWVEGEGWKPVSVEEQQSNPYISG
ncbi:YrrS family protein [Salipaludibacillus sp. CF4.18]|uniref:YrrS family protein n=1 Tax=Salipaludibacillus sp. CF4.18 TaxID=3373081 RepID=UPI003EE6FD28